ncbi:hypothetical protein ACVWZM_004089 [Bradyrhizobium sp. USDA 4501]
MRKSSALSLGLAGALVLIAALSRPAFAQNAADAAPDINPPVANCNPTPDTTPRGSATRTPVTPDLLTLGQPCQQLVNITGPFGDDSLANRQRGFDFYSWLTFIAMNSPSGGGQIGKGSRPGGDDKTKWENLENFRPLADIMLKDGAEPEWGTRIVPHKCAPLDTPKGEKIIVQLAEDAFNQPFKTGPLIDQDGNYALFDILLNKPMFSYIHDRGLYSKKGQQAFKEAVDFPIGVNPSKDKDGKDTPGRMGAIMLKVSYRILDPVKNKDIISEFHTRDALIYFPGPPITKEGPACVEKKLGLVGFHVGHKTNFAPQWVWTSFEHVSNAPDENDIGSGNLLKRYNFYKAKCDGCAPNETPLKPWAPPLSLQFPTTFRSQVVRKTMLPPLVLKEITDLNKQFQALLKGTVWEHYMLLATQWPSEFDNPTDPLGAPAPTYLANSTLETFSQGKVPLASSSCMACHGNAVDFQLSREVAPGTIKGFNQSDFTFTLEKAQ